jgi:hypothetical protein
MMSSLVSWQDNNGVIILSDTPIQTDSTYGTDSTCIEERQASEN